MSSHYTYLALGDSYTIGEGVLLHESYPYQVVQLLRKAGKQVYGPEIIAKTGWTTSELASHIDHIILNTAYDFVSLLIGVNNQYQGLTEQHYSIEFEELLNRAISFAGNKPPNVFVLSIPNWGLTPFAKGRGTDSITKAITDFNNISREISLKYTVGYIDITSSSPETAEEPSFLALDGLHPSGIAYRRWADLLFAEILKRC
jgi:lysophospholipase L1-like esterase